MARPAFAPTKVQRRRVAIAAGAGMSHEEIALGLDISRPTLEKHFAHELSVGAYRARLETVEALHKAAKRGNVAAIKAYAALTPRAAAPPPQQPEGKKEQANVAAKTAQVGTEWEDLLKSSPALPLQ